RALLRVAPPTLVHPLHCFHTLPIALAAAGRAATTRPPGDLANRRAYKDLVVTEQKAHTHTHIYHATLPWPPRRPRPSRSWGRCLSAFAACARAPPSIPE